MFQKYRRRRLRLIYSYITDQGSLFYYYFNLLDKTKLLYALFLVWARNKKIAGQEVQRFYSGPNGLLRARRYEIITHFIVYQNGIVIDIGCK